MIPAVVQEQLEQGELEGVAPPGRPPEPRRRILPLLLLVVLLVALVALAIWGLTR